MQSAHVQVATKALQLHPAEPGLWAAVAAWEWEVNADAAAARALMQRGLRACPKSASLWVDYFRLELLFAAKLHARRRVLGLTGLPRPSCCCWAEAVHVMPAVLPLQQDGMAVTLHRVSIIPHVH